jgi:hypothetical protein
MATQYGSNVDKPLGMYYDEGQVDPDEADIELSLNQESDYENITEFEDGSVDIGPMGMGEDSELPPMDQIPHSANLVAYLEDDELNEIATNITEAWEADNESRKEWSETYAKGLDLLGMKIEERDEPFAGASGVYHPLLAEAVVQFQAQAYKELLPAGGPVDCKVLGSKTNERVEQANRVKDYLNYLITEVMEEYEPDMDQLLFYLPLSGSAFKKTYFDPLEGRTTSEFITADHITVPYSATHLNKAPRIIHDFMMSGNDILKYQENGFYADTHLSEAPSVDETEISKATDEITGTKPVPFELDDEYQILEANVNLDHELLATQQGVAQPYIVTFERDSGTVLAIRRNWQQGDPLSKRIEHFVHYKFMPGLGFYGFGLIHMIGGLTASVTAILRQLIDAGTFANLPGGFKAKGLRVAGEDDPIEPGEWRDIDSPGGALRESLMPLPYKEPSAVLATLLGVLVESGQRFASIADMQIGDTAGQQQPVGTTVAMLERGTKVMSAIHKRLHRSQKSEFKILARIVSDSLPDQVYPYAAQEQDGQILKQDFDSRVDVVPVSDPNIFSMAQRIMLAQQQLVMAQEAPQLHNLKEAYRRMYKAMNIDDIETLLVPDKQPQNLTPMQENRNILMNIKLEAIPEMDHQAHIQGHLQMLAQPSIQNNIEFASNLIQDIIAHISFIAQQTQNPVQTELELFAQIAPQLANVKGDNVTRLQDRQLDIEQEDNRMKTATNLVQTESKERIEDGKLAGDIIRGDINERVEVFKTATSATNGNQNSQN